MPQYRIIAGEHCEGNEMYAAYQKGDVTRNDVLTSNRDLITLFPNKFERYAPKPHDVLPIASQQLEPMSEDDQ